MPSCLLLNKLHLFSRTQPKFILIQTVRYMFRSVLCLALSARCMWTDTHFCNSKLQPTSCNVFTWFIYFYRRSTYFMRFLRPSLGAHNCTYTFRYCHPILLLAATMEEISTVAAVLVDNTWRCMYSYVLLMMGGGTAWNM